MPICAFCSKPFEKTRYNRIYCSTKCNANASAHRVRAREKTAAEIEQARLMREVNIATPQLAADEAISRALSATASEKLREDSASAISDLTKIMGYTETDLDRDTTEDRLLNDPEVQKTVEELKRKQRGIVTSEDKDV